MRGIIFEEFTIVEKVAAMVFFAISAILEQPGWERHGRAPLDTSSITMSTSRYQYSSLYMDPYIFSDIHISIYARNDTDEGSKISPLSSHHHHVHIQPLLMQHFSNMVNCICPERLMIFLTILLQNFCYRSGRAPLQIYVPRLSTRHHHVHQTHISIHIWIYHSVHASIYIISDIHKYG